MRFYLIDNALFIIIIQKIVYIGYLITFYGPLSFVLAVTISKEAYDDIQRYKRDKVIKL